MNIRKLSERKSKGFCKVKKTKRSLNIKKYDGNIPFEHVTIFVHGYKHIGKTAFCSQFENSLFLSFDPPNESLIHECDEINSWKDFLDKVNELVTYQDEFCYKYIILDNVEKAYELCYDNFCRKHNVETPNHYISHGGGYKILKKEFEKPLHKILKSKYTMIATGHTAYKSITSPEGEEFHIVTCDGSKQMLDFFEKYLSTTVCFCYQKNKKVLRIKGSSKYNVDSRLDNKFFYTDGTPVSIIPMGKSKEEGFKNFKLAFNNKLVKPKIKNSHLNKMKG